MYGEFQRDVLNDFVYGQELIEKAIKISMEFLNKKNLNEVGLDNQFALINIGIDPVSLFYLKKKIIF